MKCPQCNVAINFEEEGSPSWQDETLPNNEGYGLEYGHCPNCYKLIVIYKIGEVVDRGSGYNSIFNATSEEIIFPKLVSRKVEPEVPERYRKDFAEACSVLPISPKASAAISRRLLQDILRQEFNISRPNLAQEIDEFISMKDVPSFLADAVDAVRNIGNFAAHPLKDTHTGEIVDVEPGESEWLLEVIDSLFDFAFIQPKQLEEKKRNLNQKLQAMGKPAMKDKKSYHQDN